MPLQHHITLITFIDGSFVSWQYLGKVQRLYRKEKRYTVHVRVEKSDTVKQCIDQFFETWDRPSEHRAEWFIKMAIKDAL